MHDFDIQYTAMHSKKKQTKNKNKKRQNTNKKQKQKNKIYKKQTICGGKSP